MKEMLENLIIVLELKQQQIKEGNPKGLTQYAEGKIDGINVSIRDIEHALKLLQLR